MPLRHHQKSGLEGDTLCGIMLEIVHTYGSKSHYVIVFIPFLKVGNRKKRFKIFDGYLNWPNDLYIIMMDI